jgi:hypothetical protein
MLRSLVIVAVGLADRRPHGELAARDRRHLQADAAPELLDEQ